MPGVPMPLQAHSLGMGPISPQGHPLSSHCTDQPACAKTSSTCRPHLLTAPHAPTPFPPLSHLPHPHSPISLITFAVLHCAHRLPLPPSPTHSFSHSTPTAGLCQSADNFSILLPSFLSLFGAVGGEGLIVKHLHATGH